jgi:hypothetical protein
VPRRKRDKNGQLDFKDVLVGPEYQPDSYEKWHRKILGEHTAFDPDIRKAFRAGERSCQMHGKRIEKLEGKVETLARMLASLGRHSESCSIRWADDGVACDCGLYEALKVADPEMKESKNDSQDV